MEHVMYKKIEQLEKQHAAEVAKLERQCGKWANKAYVASEQKEAAEGDVADLEDFVAQLQQQVGDGPADVSHVWCTVCSS